MTITAADVRAVSGRRRGYTKHRGERVADLMNEFFAEHSDAERQVCMGQYGTDDHNDVQNRCVDYVIENYQPVGFVESVLFWWLIQALISYAVRELFDRLRKRYLNESGGVGSVAPGY